MTSLRVQGLRAGYGPVPVLTGLDLTVRSGSLTAVLGASGCGKSTLLRVVAGFHRATAGRIALDERIVAGPGFHVPSERRRVGIVAQDGALFGHLSVAGNVGFGLRRAQRSSGRIGQLLELVGLAGFERRMPAELSGGQQQRVALARALAPQPDLVLLDEPFTALDTGLRAEVRADVRAVLAASGSTAVLVTHDQQEALGLADEVAVLREGRIVQCAPPQELYAAPVDPGVALFVGEAIVLAAERANGARVRTVLGELPTSGLSPAGPGRVVLRPEQLTVLPADAAGVTATLRGTVFHGHDATVLLDRDGQQLRAKVRQIPPGVPGDAVRVQVSGSALFYPDPDPNPDPDIPPLTPASMRRSTDAGH